MTRSNARKLPGPDRGEATALFRCCGSQARAPPESFEVPILFTTRILAHLTQTFRYFYNSLTKFPVHPNETLTLPVSGMDEARA